MAFDLSFRLVRHLQQRLQTYFIHQLETRQWDRRLGNPENAIFFYPKLTITQFASTFRKIEYSRTNHVSTLRKELAKIKFYNIIKGLKAHLQLENRKLQMSLTLYPKYILINNIQTLAFNLTVKILHLQISVHSKLFNN